MILTKINFQDLPYSHALLQVPSSAVEEDLSEFSAKALAIQNMPRRN